MATCRNCSNEFVGKYCNACGEKAFDEKDKTLHSIFEEAFHFITHFDNKFFSTIKLVLFRPGRYSKTYTEGKKKPFFKPVSMFLICVILYLIFPMFKGLNMKLNTYVSEEYGYTFLAIPVVKAKLKNNIDYPTLMERYDAKSPKFAKILLLLFLPLSALVLKGLFYRRKKYFYDHFVLATELNTFFVFVIFLLLPLLMYLIVAIHRGAANFFDDDGFFFTLFYLLFLWVSVRAMRTFYAEKWGWVIIKAIVFLVLFNFVVKFIYNIVLFLLVMLFV